MRNDFAVFILTHGRAENVVTLKTILKKNYTGKWYMVIDDEDEQGELYRKLYGSEHVIEFCKQKVYDSSDTMDNLNEHRAIIYARNECWAIANRLGLNYFLMLDDDYAGLDYRYIADKKLKAKPVKNCDKLFEYMIQFLIESDADTVAFAQGGDFIGGANGGRFAEGLIRKAMNSFFCRADRPIEFRGTMNEDVTTYTTLGSRGRLFFTVCDVCVIQLATQSLKGGMSDAYHESGTYMKAFYSVMSMPSSVKVSMMHTSHERIHHKIDWGKTVPKIINEEWRKAR